jgi:hypothetical protein
VERPARVEHSSLFCSFISDKEKSFTTFSPNDAFSNYELHHGAIVAVKKEKNGQTIQD